MEENEGLTDFEALCMYRSRIKKTINFIKTTKNIIIEQPSEDKTTDLWFLYKLDTIWGILTGDNDDLL